MGLCICVMELLRCDFVELLRCGVVELWSGGCV